MSLISKDIKESFKLFGLDCIKKDGAAYLTTGPLAGSLLPMDQGVRNMKSYTNASLVDLAKISSTNALRFSKSFSSIYKYIKATAFVWANAWWIQAGSFALWYIRPP